jgi:hypothetical protein
VQDEEAQRDVGDEGEEQRSMSLAERVDALIRAHKSKVLSTTPQSVVIVELAERVETLERVVHEIALAFDKRSPSSF